MADFDFSDRQQLAELRRQLQSESDSSGSLSLPRDFGAPTAAESLRRMLHSLHDIDFECNLGSHASRIDSMRQRKQALDSIMSHLPPRTFDDAAAVTEADYVQMLRRHLLKRQWTHLYTSQSLPARSMRHNTEFTIDPALPVLWQTELNSRRDVLPLVVPTVVAQAAGAAATHRVRDTEEDYLDEDDEDADMTESEDEGDVDAAEEEMAEDQTADVTTEPATIAGAATEADDAKPATDDEPGTVPIQPPVPVLDAEARAAKTLEAEQALHRLEQKLAVMKSEFAEVEERLLQEAAEKTINARRKARIARMHAIIALHDIPKAYRHYASGMSSVLAMAKRLAVECQREVRRRLVRPSVRLEKEAGKRAKKLVGDMTLYWRRNEKLERERRKKAEKELEEQRRREAEEREARRQQRKFNYLITQTELYAHFMRNKTTGDASAASAAASGILTKLDSTPDPDAEGDESGEDLKARALTQVQQAVTAARERTKTFDAERDRQRDGGHAAAASASGANLTASQAEFDNSFSLANPNMQGMQEVEKPAMLKADLKSYQLKGLRWLANLFEQGINGILADEMGLGKTVQSIALLTHLAEHENIWGPFIIVTPASTLHNWCDELQRFAPDFKIIPYWGSIPERKTLRTFWSGTRLCTRDSPFHVTVTSYEMVVRDAKYVSRVNWQYMVLDEAQAIKNSSSFRWNILLKFQCRNRLLLTGTPIQNTMAELWSLLHFIMPTLFDSHAEFDEWFSKDIESHAQNTASKLDQAQLSRLHMILQPFMLRRVKKNVENELADKVELQLDCHLSVRQQRLYRALRRNLNREQLMGAGGDSSKGKAVSTASTERLMNLVMQFRKVCNHPDLIHRRPVLSPFYCSAPAAEGYGRVESALNALGNLTVLGVSVLQWQVSKLLFREIWKWDYDSSRPLEHRQWLAQRHGCMHPEPLHRAMLLEDRTSQSSLSNCLRLAGWCAGEVAELMTSSDMERLLLVHLTELHAEQRLWGAGDEAWELPAAESARARNAEASVAFKVTDRPLSIVRVQDWAYAPRIALGERRPEAWGMLPLSQLHHAASTVFGKFRLFVPAAAAPPLVPECSDTAWPHYWRDRFQSGWGHCGLVALHSRVTTSQVPRRGQLLEALAQVPEGGMLSTLCRVDSWSPALHPETESLIMDCGKMQVLDKLMRQLKQEGHRVLIYSQMTRMIDLLEEYVNYRGYKYMRLDGSSKISDRRDMVADFQSRPDIFAFLLSTRAGGLGINLTAADTVIFYDSDWNPTVDQQAMDRAHRLGQTRQVTVYRLITKGTIEERILVRAQEKAKVHQMVIQGNAVESDKMRSTEVVSLLFQDDEEEGVATEGSDAASAAIDLDDETGAEEEEEPLADATDLTDSMSEMTGDDEEDLDGDERPSKRTKAGGSVGSRGRGGRGRGRGRGASPSARGRGGGRGRGRGGARGSAGGKRGALGRVQDGSGEYQGSPLAKMSKVE